MCGAVPRALGHGHCALPGCPVAISTRLGATAGLGADMDRTAILPDSECLKDTVERFMPYWLDSIKPDIESGKNVLIVAHGNSLRALVKYLDKVSDDDIVELNIPTGVPLVYELDDAMNPVKSYYLGNQEEISKRTAEVAAQGKNRSI